jgi:hypothetical protein
VSQKLVCPWTNRPLRFVVAVDCAVGESTLDLNVWMQVRCDAVSSPVICDFVHQIGTETFGRIARKGIQLLSLCSLVIRFLDL